MTSATPQNEEVSLTQTFNYESSTHKFSVKWGTIGDPANRPLILIHGTPWSSRLWVPFATSLSNQFRVYCFDRPGFGESPPERELPGVTTSSDKVSQFDGNLARQSEVYAALFKSWLPGWGNLKPHVVAHDNAGLISLRANLLHDCQYASLCLIDVVAIGPFGQPLFKAIGDNPHYFEQLPDMAFDGILESYIRNAAFRALRDEDMQMLKAPWLRSGGKQGFIRELCQADARSTEEVEPRYGEVGSRLPVKIIWGANDNWIPVESAWRLGKALKAREVVIIKEAGHLVMLDQPAQVGVELGRWLTAVLPSSKRYFGTIV